VSPLARLFGPLASRIYRAYFGTLRLRLMTADGRPFDLATYPFDNEIFAICERDLVLLMGLVTVQPMIVLIAPGRDGDWAAAFVERAGCRVLRGSSRHNAIASLDHLLTLGGERAPMLMVVDGPSGPPGRAKTGATVLAARTGRPICAVSGAARPAITLPGTWSGLYVPLPWASGRIVCSDRLRLTGGMSRAERQEHAAQLTGILRRQRVTAEAML
jgi:lysophospholipid acyltransferase (LPLAT)-like uncharacterized protein